MISQKNHLLMLMAVCLTLNIACKNEDTSSGCEAGCSDSTSDTSDLASHDGTDDGDGYDQDDDGDGVETSDTDSETSADLDGEEDSSEEETPWGEVDNVCPPETLSETPYAESRDPGEALGEPGLLWTKNPSCPESDDSRDLDQEANGGGFLYGVIDWNGSPREVLLNINNVSNRRMLDNPIHSVSVLDATSGERLACLELPEGPDDVQAGASVLLGDPPTLYVPHTGPFLPDNPDAPMHVGVKALNIAPSEQSPVRFDKRWDTTRSEGPSVSASLNQVGLLGVAVSVDTTRSGFVAMDAFSGELFWDYPLTRSGLLVHGYPRDGFTLRERSGSESALEYTRLDKCGQVVGASPHIGVPLGAFNVSEDLEGEPQVKIWDGDGSLELSVSCSRPVAVDQSTIACMERFRNTLKIIDLNRMSTHEAELPGTNEVTGDEQIFHRQTIALQERKVLTSVGLRNDTGGIDNYFYIYDIDTEELTLNQVIDGGGWSFDRPWAMSHRGVLYGVRDSNSSTVSAVAIQTSVRPASSPWPFGIPTQYGAGNDNRGWIEAQ